MIAYEQQLIMAPPKLGGGTYDTVRVSSPSLGTGTTDSTTVIPWCAKKTLLYYLSEVGIEGSPRPRLLPAGHRE
jgi:hypothetical protein